jgi:hypothetical protein
LPRYKARISGTSTIDVSFDNKQIATQGVLLVAPHRG